MNTRFQQEISGQLGDYWKESAQKRVKEYIQKATSDAIVDQVGAIKWKSNGQYLMDDYCEVLEYGGFDFSRAATSIARSIQQEESIARYKENRQQPSAEEIFEMRAAFGRGKTVIDVIAGQEIQL